MGQVERRPALFLDRDGVINVDTGYVHLPNQFCLIKPIIGIMKSFKSRGHLIIVVTNQAGIARGHYNERQFHDFTAWISVFMKGLGAPIDRTYYCPYHPSGSIKRFRRVSMLRKPNPGMLYMAQKEMNVEMNASTMIGDKSCDLEAARQASVGSYFSMSGGDHQLHRHW